MKKILLVFMVLGFLAHSNAYANIGKDEKESEMGGWLSKKLKTSGTFIDNAYSNVMKLVYNTTAKLKNSAYTKMNNIMNSEIIITLIALIIFFWLYKLLKNGGSIGKEEIYKAMTFAIIFIFVYVILNSKGAFNEVMNMFKLPSKILQEIFGGQDFTKNALTNVFGKPFMETFNVFLALYDDYTNNVSFFGTQYLTGIFFAGALMILYLLYILVALAVIVGVVIMQSYSIFLEGIYTSFAPIVILLLLIPQTKGIFFAWVKSYIGITLYVPLSGIAIKILAANPAKIPAGDEAIYALFIFSMTGLFLAILSLSILSKIPVWINELLGGANQGVGMGGAISMAKMAGDAVGKLANKSVGKAGSNLLNAGKGLKDSVTSKGSMGQKAGSALSSLGSIATGGIVSKDGFTAMGKFAMKQLQKNKTGK